MDRRTDNDNRLSRMGGNSPIPEGCMACPYRQDIDNVKMRLLQMEMREKRRNRLFSQMSLDNDLPQQPSLVVPTEPIAPSVPVIIAEAPEIVEERIVDLPEIFVESLYNDVPRYNKLMHLLRGELQMRVKNRQQRTLHWWHVHKVLEDCKLIYKDLSKKKFGDALKRIIGGLPKADTLRKLATSETLGKLEKEDFHTWPENNFDRYLCKLVEKLLIDHAVLAK